MARLQVVNRYTRTPGTHRIQVWPLLYTFGFICFDRLLAFREIVRQHWRSLKGKSEQF